MNKNTRIVALLLSGIGWLGVNAAPLPGAKLLVSVARPASRKLHAQRFFFLSWPPLALAWLRSHEVPPNLKQRLDTIFLQRDTLRHISTLCGSYKYPSNNSEVSLADVLRWKAIDILQSKGFEFVATLSTNRGYVLKHKDAPGYVFKIGQALIIKRIAQAHELKKRLQAEGNSSIIFPQKYVYILDRTPPTIKDENVPTVIVVAEEIPPLPHPTKEEGEQLDKDRILLHKIGFMDTHTRNVYASQKGTAVIDTDRFEGTIPGLSQQEQAL